MLPVSVVIPCLDDAAALQVCLRSLANQTVLPAEIIVVDNGSRDDSVRIATGFGAVVVHEPAPGIPAAAAAGYDRAAATGRDKATVAAGSDRGTAAEEEQAAELIIARCDADSVLPADWIERIAAVFDNDPALNAMTGPGRFYGVGPWRGRALNVLYMYGYFLAVGAALANVPLFGSNFAMRRSCWEAVRDEIHRRDQGMHDDICLSMHIGLRFPIRFCRSLAVGISPRAVAGSQNVRIRFRRAFHTLGAHGRSNLPWNRWQRRLQERRGLRQ